MESVESRLGEVRDLLARLSDTDEANSAVADAKNRLARAEDFFGVVKHDGSYGVHNVEYIDDILLAAGKEIAESKKILTALPATQ